MKSISKLKDEARRYEQREEWEKAIQAYLQVLRTADEGEADVELPLYNRVGDLCVRLGKPQEAVRHYEQAADRYADAGLYNNAIALCNKALRYNPDRLELVRKLGQFSASQGFITDARRYFLDYAERQFKAGKVAEALNALEDFANVSDDADIREMLGRQLHTHGRINDAVVELQRARALRLRDGQTEQAAALRDEILSIDPQAEVDGDAAAPSAGARQDSGELPGLVEIEPTFPESVTPPDAGAVEGLEAGALPGESDDGVEGIEIVGFEGTAGTDSSDAPAVGSGMIEGLETTSLDFDTVEADVPTLDDLGLEREETSFDGNVTEDAGVFDLPTLDDPDATSLELPTLDDDSDSDFDLPLLDDADGGFDLPTLDDPEPAGDLPTLDEPEAAGDLPALDEPEAAGDLPTFDEPEAAGDLPALDEPSTDLSGLETEDSAFDLPLLDDSPAPTEPETPSFDLPLLGGEEPPPGHAAATDDARSPDAPGDEAPVHLGGDLTIDLSSLGGAGAFELSPAEDEDDGEDGVEDPAPGDWSGGHSFDIPDLDDEALGITTWEPEGDTFEIPSFDSEEAADETSESDSGFDLTGTDAAAEALPGLDEPDLPVGGSTDLYEPGAVQQGDAEDLQPLPEADAEPLRIPAIELPTWETGILEDGPAAFDTVAPDVDAGVDAALTEAGTGSGRDEAADDAEPAEQHVLDDAEPVDDLSESVEDAEFAEPAWLDGVTSEDEESAPDLPTFTYEDEAGQEPIAAGDDDADQPDGSIVVPELTSTVADDSPLPDTVDTGAADQDEDPLDLASHLRGASPGATDEPGAAPAVVPDTDWLDEIADDEDTVEVGDEDAAASAADAAGEDVAGSFAAADDDVALSGAGATVEDTVGETAAAESAAAEMAAEEPPSADADGDEYIDLAALIASDGEEETTRFRVQETAPTGDEDRDFAELLSQFKSKVHEHLPTEDAAAHYDLGLAFKEMGLIDEAIGEFQIALRAGHMRLKVYEELGQCFLQKEQFNIAEKVLSRALTMKFDDELELLGVYYHLGRAYEALGRRDDARDAYERVLGMDISFGDVTDRLARL